MNSSRQKLLQKWKSRQASMKYRDDGGPGSGNWGHAGVKGQLGGSAPGGGSSNRYSTEGGGFTSMAKMKSTLAKPHKADSGELWHLPKGSIVLAGGEKYTVSNPAHLKSESTGKFVTAWDLASKLNSSGQKVKVALNESNSKEVEHFMSEMGAKKYVAPKEASEQQATSNEPTESGTSYDISHLSTEEIQSKFNKAKIYDEEESLDAYGPTTEKAWSTMDQSDKEYAYSYTTGSSFVNEPLHGKYYLGYKDEDGVAAIHSLTNSIDKCPVPADTIMYHGVDAKGFQKLMGISSLDDDELDFAVDTVGKDNGFCSCGAERDTGMLDNDVVMRIYVPKNAKGMYVEPFSHYGSGADSPNWNGKVTQETVSDECEVILQRGGSYHMLGWTRKNGTVYADFALIGQDYSDCTEAQFGKYAK